MHLCGFCSLLVWFCILQALPLFFGLWWILVLSFLDFIFFSFLFFLFFVFLCRGGSGVLSHGAGFLFMLRNTVVMLDN